MGVVVTLHRVSPDWADHVRGAAPLDVFDAVEALRGAPADHVALDRIWDDVDRILPPRRLGLRGRGGSVLPRGGEPLDDGGGSLEVRLLSAGAAGEAARAVRGLPPDAVASHLAATRRGDLLGHLGGRPLPRRGPDAADRIERAGSSGPWRTCGTSSRARPRPGSGA